MIQVIIGNILISISIIFVFVGLFGVFRFRDFYAKLLSASKIDTAAMITLMLGIAVRGGISWFTLKALLVLIFVIFINPVVTSKILMSAREDEGQEDAARIQTKKGRNAHGN